jgi:hypothetical protein
MPSPSAGVARSCADPCYQWHGIALHFEVTPGTVYNIVPETNDHEAQDPHYPYRRSHRCCCTPRQCTTQTVFLGGRTRHCHSAYALCGSGSVHVHRKERRSAHGFGSIMMCMSGLRRATFSDGLKPVANGNQTIPLRGIGAKVLAVRFVLLWTLCCIDCCSFFPFPFTFFLSSQCAYTIDIMVLRPAGRLSSCMGSSAR